MRAHHRGYGHPAMGCGRRESDDDRRCLGLRLSLEQPEHDLQLDRGHAHLGSAGHKAASGSTNLTSAHVTLSSKVGDRSVLTAQGEETPADGRVTAMCLDEHAGTINLTILLVSADAVGWLCSTGRVSHEPA
jgi:hypothetical protein